MHRSQSSSIKQQYKVNHLPYDPIKSEIGFQHIGMQLDNKQVLAEFEYRVEQIIATNDDLQNLNNLVDKLKIILKKYPLIKCVHEVGSYAMKTMRKAKLVADIVLEFGAIPVEVDFCKLITEDVVKDLKEEMTVETIDVQKVTRDGIQLTCPSGSCILFPATQNIDSKITDGHISKDHLQSNMLMVSHVNWFRDHGVHGHASALITLIFDAKERYQGLAALSPWLCCLLGQYCILNTLDRRAVPLHTAFKRFLQLLACGFFLSHCQGILDETLHRKPRAHMALTLQQQDEICCTAQTLLRIFCHGEYRNVIGLEESDLDLKSNILVNSIIVQPSLTLSQS